MLPYWSFSERSLSPSDTELSSPELAVCYDLHGTAEDDDINEDKEQEISQNGQEVLHLQTLNALVPQNCQAIQKILFLLFPDWVYTFKSIIKI